jgi:hypothetical protein
MKLFYCYGPPLIRERRRDGGKGEAWEGEEGKGRKEKRMGGREELGRPETRGNKKVRQIFTGGSLLHCLRGMDAPCYPDVIRFVYEEFKVDEVKKVEKRRNAKRVV